MISSSSLTIKNSKNYSKPNEDYLICDNQYKIYIVMDGVSRDRENGVYPSDSPSYKASKIFSDFVYNYIKENLHLCDDLKHLLHLAMVKGNVEIANFNKNYTGNFLPGTVGIITLISNNIFYYSYIGDCYGVRITDKKEYFTSPQTHLIHEHLREFSAYQIRNDICNNINHPYSYGVLNGEKKAEDFIVTGSFLLDNVKNIFLFSDGFEPFMNQKQTNELLNLDITGLDIKNDYLSDDDKTIIKIQLDG